MFSRWRLIRSLLFILVMTSGVLASIDARADTWRPMNEPGFGNPDNDSALAMAVFDGHLYVATRNLKGSEVWKSRLGTQHWREVTPPWNTGTTAVQAMAVFGGRLYLGTDRGEVWRTAGQLVLDRCRPIPFRPGCLPLPGFPVVTELWSAATPTSMFWRHSEVTSLAVFGGRLFLVASDPLEIWRSTDGLAWGLITGGGFGDPVNNHSGNLAVFRDHLYVGTSREVVGGPGGPGDGLEIWRSADGFAWSAVVATGEPGAIMPSGFGLSGNTSASALEVFRDRLYVSTINHHDFAQIWRFGGSTWEEVTPAEVASGVLRIQTLAVFGRRIFAGQGITTPERLTLWGSSTGEAWAVVGAGFGDDSSTAVDAMTASPSHLYTASQAQKAGVRIWQKQPSLLDRIPFDLPRCRLFPDLCGPLVPID